MLPVHDIGNTAGMHMIHITRWIRLSQKAPGGGTEKSQVKVSSLSDASRGRVADPSDYQERERGVIDLEITEKA
jgi:hypothetical protein